MLALRFVFAAVLLQASVVFVYSAEIGRTTLNGRTAVLDSNGTWKFEDSVPGVPGSSPVCPTGYAFESKRIALSLCLPAVWKVDAASPGSVELQAENTDLDLFMAVIVDRLDTTPEAVRRAALFHAAKAAGVRVEDIPVVAERSEKVAGRDWNYLEYEVSMAGTKLRFGNYNIALPKGGAVQIAFWASPSFFDRNIVAAADVLQSVRLDTP